MTDKQRDRGAGEQHLADRIVATSHFEAALEAANTIVAPIM